MDNGLNEDLVFRYMCGELSEDDRNRLEKDYFASDEVFDAVRAIEDDWIDQFVRGELSDDRRGRFERGFLPSADARHRIAVARSLVRAAGSAAFPPSASAAAVSPARPAVPRWLPYAAVVGAAAGGLWLYRGSQPSTETAEGLRPVPTLGLAARTPLPNAGAAVPTGSPGAPTAEPPSPRAVRLVLVAAALRSPGDEHPVQVPADADRLAIEAHLPSETIHPACRAVLEAVAGQPLWKQDGLRIVRTPSGPIVNVDVPAEVLRPGSFVLTLSADTGTKSEELASYPLTLVR
jgi:hypothetical protein